MALMSTYDPIPGGGAIVHWKVGSFPLSSLFNPLTQLEDLGALQDSHSRIRGWKRILIHFPRQNRIWWQYFRLFLCNKNVFNTSPKIGDISYCDAHSKKWGSCPRPPPVAPLSDRQYMMSVSARCLVSNSSSDRPITTLWCTGQQLVRNRDRTVNSCHDRVSSSADCSYDTDTQWAHCSCCYNWCIA